jgi:hypothetical protein
MVSRPHRNQGTSTDATFRNATLAATESWFSELADVHVRQLAAGDFQNRIGLLLK